MILLRKVGQKMFLRFRVEMSFEGIYIYHAIERCLRNLQL